MKPPFTYLESITPRVIASIPEGGPIRLNLGGRDTRIDGFLNVDLYEESNPDVICDCASLSLFKDGSVEEIYASNILEHWPHVETVNVLKEWKRVLKPSGKLWISVPDMNANLKIIAKHGLTPWAINLLWGDQIGPYAYHYINFTFATLAKAVYDAGFSDVKRVETLPYGLSDASEHRDNFDLMKISLNVEVTK